MFEIEDGVPVPPKGNIRPASPLRLVLQALRPGQSILVPAVGRPGMGAVSKMAWRVLGTGGYRCDRHDEQHVRIWRLQP